MALLLLLLLIAVIVGTGVLKARARMHYVNEVRATRDFVAGAGPTLPSWYGNPLKMEMFCDGLARFAQREGIPMPFTRLALSNSKSSGPIFAFAANLENQGSSFAEQQLGTSRFLLASWNELGSSERAEIARMATF